jgi:transcriptional repressor NrdR
MKCPYCGGQKTMVTDSRDSGDLIRRRRRCDDCKRKFSTYERIETEQLMVIKRDGSRAPYDRDKIYKGMHTACEKRPLPVWSLDRAVEEF